MLGTQVLRAVSQTPECSSLHIFLVRGTTEEYPGVQQHIAEAICSGLDDCAYSSIQYPAVFEDYCHSVEVGINSTHAALEDYVARCPDASIVLSGFSQGGQVVGDALAGGGDAGETQNCENGQTVTEALNPDEAPGNKGRWKKPFIMQSVPSLTMLSCIVIAALLWGSTRHTANQTYNVLDGASKDGVSKPFVTFLLGSLHLTSNPCLVDAAIG